MCGFVGAIGKRNKPFQRETLDAMSGLLVHRGPDDSGTFEENGWLSLAFRRLSILDLSPLGHQPMLSPDGRHAIVFNGEVYNYVEIRKELEGRGHQFCSATDTEVVLTAYREWGEASLEKFVGMYAFIIADLRERDIFAACDPLGIKPLFFYEDPDFLILTSEIKALLPYRDLELNPDAVHESLVFRSVVGRHTLFRDVHALRPGHRLRFRNGQLSETCHFRLADTLKPDRSRNFAENCEAVENALTESVKFHLRSDVELGVQLSGGVDSSLITAIAARETGRKLHTFSISFAESFYDESKYQKMVSDRYGTIHHDYPMTDRDFTDLLPETVWHYEHPLNDPNAVATLFLTKRARDFITVMLSGEGADEAFLGYTRFKSDSIRRLRFRTWLHQNPKIRTHLLNLWPIEKGRALFRITRYRPAMYGLSYADLNDIDRLLEGNDQHMEFRREISSWRKHDALEEAMLQDQVCDLQQWFWRADRIGMAASMELRVPFCTATLFRLANSIPYKQRVFHGERKAILKKIAEHYLDHEQIYRKKIGFGTPVDDWINRPGPCRDLFEETLSSPAFRSRPFFNHRHAARFVEGHLTGRYREVNSGFLWTYFSLETWYRIFFEGQWRKFVRQPSPTPNPTGATCAASSLT